jgi:nucleotide-binding universal stress UspA family protein
MLPISKILVPVDFSERSLGVLPYAKAFAVRYQAPLTLIHVVSPFFVIPATGLSGPAFIPVADSTVIDRQEQLEEWAPGQLEHIEVRRVVYEGDPLAQIVEFAASEQIDLVVMSTHGYGNLRRFLIGSMAAKLLDDLPCPVLTGVHLDPSHPSEPVVVSKIVCAVDLGPRASSTLSYASGLAEDFNAELEVVYVAPPALETVEPASKEVRSSVKARVKDKLQAIVMQAGVRDASLHIVEGDVPEAVSSFSGSMGADMLVIGRGSHAESAGRLRTNAYAIIRQSPCPVLSV